MSERGFFSRFALLMIGVIAGVLGFLIWRTWL
jgi:hypothetical protein